MCGLSGLSGLFGLKSLSGVSSLSVLSGLSGQRGLIGLDQYENLVSVRCLLPEALVVIYDHRLSLSSESESVNK